MRRRGFTMVETMVALSIALIVIGATMVLVLGGFNNFGRTSNSTAYDQAGDGIYGIVRDSLLDAPLLLLSKQPLDGTQLNAQLSGTPLQDVRCLYLRSGRLLLDMDLSDNSGQLNGDNLLGDDFYLQTRLEMNASFTPDSPYLSLEVLLTDDGLATVYRKTSGFSLLNTIPLAVDDGPYQFIYFMVNN